jgi:HTH-type transcriptional regulator, sugar sensing transcriptional regulator
MELVLEKTSVFPSLDTIEAENPLFKENSNISRLTIEQTLENFGMQKNEIKVYLHLAEEGSKKAKDICNTIKIHRTETYRLLHHLEKKGLVYNVLEKPVKFFAVPLDEAIDLLVETQKTKIQMLQNKKAELVHLWMSIPQKKRIVVKKQLFQKLEGEQQIILRASEILGQTQNEFQLFATDEYLAELYYGGFFDKLKKLHSKLDITLLTSLSQKSSYFLEKIRWPIEKHRKVEIGNLPSFIISDRNELLVAFNEGERSSEFGHKKKLKNMAVWTNYPAIVAMLEMLFLKLNLME